MEQTPTQWAYDQACKTLNKYKDENESLHERIKVLEAALTFISAQPIYDVPSNEIPKYHSAVIRLNACSDMAEQALKEG